MLVIVLCGCQTAQQLQTNQQNYQINQFQSNEATDNTAAIPTAASTKTVVLFNMDANPANRETSSTVTTRDAHQQHNAILVTKDDATFTSLANPVVQQISKPTQAIAKRVNQLPLHTWSASDGQAYKKLSVKSQTAFTLTTPEAQLADAVALPPRPITMQPKPPARDLWELTREQFQLPKQTNPIALQRIKKYYDWLKKNPSYLLKVTKRSKRYYHHIFNTIVKNKLPGEIALLPIVESGFDPFAYSHSQAAGIWQFIPSTGQIYGLKQNWWYDGRRDPIASTQAAINYLEHLHAMFKGDWLLALASYNAGQGTVLKAIRKNKRANRPTNFWALDLPRETRQYVPKLLAISQLVKETAGSDKVTSISNTPYFEIVNIRSQLDLAQAAKLAQVSISEIHLLNPSLNQWATDPDGPHRLLVPLGHGDILSTALEQLPAEKRMIWKRYSIKSGDTLLELAHRFNTTVEVLRDTNSISGNLIRQGEKIIIPIASKKIEAYTLSAGQRNIKLQKRTQKADKSSKVIHQIQSGDSLWAIAKRYNVTTKELASWNNLSSKSVLQVNNTLEILPKVNISQTASKRSNVLKKVNYKVRQGDNLSMIAWRFNVNVADIRIWNQSLKKYLQPEQLLTLYVDVTKTRQ